MWQLPGSAILSPCHTSNVKRSNSRMVSNDGYHVGMVRLISSLRFLVTTLSTDLSDAVSGKKSFLKKLYSLSNRSFIWIVSLLPNTHSSIQRSVASSCSLVSPNHYYTACLETLFTYTLKLKLYTGTLPDNESRLLYSSKQIEYLRYWIKAMGLLDYLIPLPHSECLLTQDMLNSVAPVIIKTGIEMKQQQKVHSFTPSCPLVETHLSGTLATW